MKGMSAEVERNNWLSYPTESSKAGKERQTTGRDYQENLSNHSAVLSLNRGVLSGQGVMGAKSLSGEYTGAERK